MTRYQGVVALEGQGLEQAAHDYFQRSEQIPTLVRLAVGAERDAGRRRVAGRRPVGAVPAQLARATAHGRFRTPATRRKEPRSTLSPEDDAWVEAKTRAATTEDHELIDPALSSERLLFRLFNERGVRVFEPTGLRDACRCSAERIDAMLQNFSAEERRAMIGDDGKIGVTCEFCSTKRVFDPADYPD